MELRRGDDKMSSAVIEETARTWARELEAKEAKRSGVSIRDARKTVARRAGLSPGTLENIKLGRTKGVRAFVFEKIRAAFMREDEAEIRRLEHELHLARQIGLDARCDEVRAVESDRKALLEAMKYEQV